MTSVYLLRRAFAAALFRFVHCSKLLLAFATTFPALVPLGPLHLTFGFVSTAGRWRFWKALLPWSPAAWCVIPKDRCRALSSILHQVAELRASSRSSVFALAFFAGSASTAAASTSRSVSGISNVAAVPQAEDDGSRGFGGAGSPL